MSEQNSLDLENTSNISNVEKFKFEPIKGYPMLHWHGKRPFTSTQYYPAQKKEIYGEEVDGWINKIFWGDNLQVMSHLLKKYRGKVDLVYIDPPFDSKADYRKKITIKGKSVSNDAGAFEEKQYTDIWANDEYLQFIYERVLLIRELMSPNGSIYLHCDYRRSHYLKLIMDEIFGADNFINEIIWVRTNAHNMKSKGYVRSNDHILFYSKGKDFTFNEEYKDYGEAQLSRYKEDADGRLFTGRDLTFSGANKEKQFEWRGTQPPPNRSWGYPKEKLEQLWNDGLILKKKDGTPRLDGLKVFLDETKGSAVTCNWDDVSRIGNTSSERLDYPTQKPEELLKRIISVSSNPGDLVFDCFMGSGTTLSVAKKLKRNFIGTDINFGAVQTTIKRLASELNNNHQLEIDQRSPSGFEFYTVNNYEVFRNPVEGKALLLEALEIQPISGSIYDGEIDGKMVKVMPINRIATREDLNELISNFPYKLFEKRKEENPNKSVESLLLICMGHEPDLKAHLEQECGYKLTVEVVDILRDKSHIDFKRDSEAEIIINNGMLIINNFFPMNLMQKLSLQREAIAEWRELVESIVIDWNFDGAAMEPSIIDMPSKLEFVKGAYDVPAGAGTIKIKIIDILSESYEQVIQHG